MMLVSLTNYRIPSKYSHPRSRNFNQYFEGGILAQISRGLKFLFIFLISFLINFLGVLTKFLTPHFRGYKLLIFQNSYRGKMNFPFPQKKFCLDIFFIKYFYEKLPTLINTHPQK